MHTKMWLHTDHLGGVSAATNSTGTVLSQQRFRPWGEVRGGDLPETTLDFTGRRYARRCLLCHTRTMAISAADTW